MGLFSKKQNKQTVTSEIISSVYSKNLTYLRSKAQDFRVKFAQFAYCIQELIETSQDSASEEVTDTVFKLDMITELSRIGMLSVSMDKCSYLWKNKELPYRNKNYTEDFPEGNHDVIYCHDIVLKFKLSVDFFMYKISSINAVFNSFISAYNPEHKKVLWYVELDPDTIEKEQKYVLNYTLLEYCIADWEAIFGGWKKIGLYKFFMEEPIRLNGFYKSLSNKLDLTGSGNNIEVVTNVNADDLMTTIYNYGAYYLEGKDTRDITITLLNEDTGQRSIKYHLKYLFHVSDSNTKVRLVYEIAAVKWGTKTIGFIVSDEDYLINNVEIMYSKCYYVEYAAFVEMIKNNQVQFFLWDEMNQKIRMYASLEERERVNKSLVYNSTTLLKHTIEYENFDSYLKQDCSIEKDYFDLMLRNQAIIGVLEKIYAGSENVYTIRVFGNLSNLLSDASYSSSVESGIFMQDNGVYKLEKPMLTVGTGGDKVNLLINTMTAESNDIQTVVSSAMFKKQVLSKTLEYIKGVNRKVYNNIYQVNKWVVYGLFSFTNSMNQRVYNAILINPASNDYDYVQSRSLSELPLISCNKADDMKYHHGLDCNWEEDWVKTDVLHLNPAIINFWIDDKIDHSLLVIEDVNEIPVGSLVIQDDMETSEVQMGIKEPVITHTTAQSKKEETSDIPDYYYVCRKFVGRFKCESLYLGINDIKEMIERECILIDYTWFKDNKANNYYLDFTKDVEVFKYNNSKYIEEE